MNKANPRQRFFKGAIVVADFLALNLLVWAILFLFKWQMGDINNLPLLYASSCNAAMAISQYFFFPIVLERRYGAGKIIRRVVQLTSFQTLLSFLILLIFSFRPSIAIPLFIQGSCLFIFILSLRYFERAWMKSHRTPSKNARKVLLVGSDPELLRIYDRLTGPFGWGYSVLGYYGDLEAPEEGSLGLVRLGSLGDFIRGMQTPESLTLGDEMFVCISRKEKRLVKQISDFCDQRIINFFYVPVSVETLGLNLKSELLDDIEVFTTCEVPLLNPVNKCIKRAFDIIVSMVALLVTGLLFPLISLIIKIQSPGPVIFKQDRTGLDGKSFVCYKFRSMHINADADRLQATKDDPRKFKFGSFMRKTNLDELPQFWNVLKGDMSIVGPRPHMLVHTEEYRKLIDKYMVRHFVRPGVTGWAQVTGYRGETKELWQMEGRVIRDIWYIEHWSLWLDIRIIWLTVKAVFVRDEKAY